MSQVRSVHSPPLISGQVCLVLAYSGAPGDAGRRFELPKDELILGRGADADIQVDRDSASRRHARIHRKDGAWHVCDLQSTNGTYVNDQPVQDHVLRHGDLLKIGNAIFKFLTGPNIEAAYFEEIHRLAITDGLTHAHNWRYFLDSLDREVSRCAYRQHPVSLIMLEVDQLKTIKDNHGELAVDYVLQELVRRLRARVRKEEVVARSGAEAFTVLLPETSREAALELAEELRGLVERQTFDFSEEKVAVTISLGVATSAPDTDAASLVKAAEESLARARRGGRNRVAGPV